MTPHKNDRRIFTPTEQGRKVLGTLIRTIRESVPVSRGPVYSQNKMVTDIASSVFLGHSEERVEFSATTLSELERGETFNETLVDAIASMRYDVPAAINPKTGRHWTSIELKWIASEALDTNGNFLVDPEELNY